MSYWIIIYPRGDRSKLDIAEICEGLEYEEGDYAIASRMRPDSEEDAAEYCRKLAKEHGLHYKYDLLD